MSDSSSSNKPWWIENLAACIAVTTLILAVCATLASFKAAGYGNKMVLAQSQASDQWAYYQAKSLKETTYQVQRDMMVIQMKESNQSDVYQTKIADYDKEITRYKQEKDNITAEAKRLERDRDTAKNLNAKFGESLIFLQVGILLSSLSSINKVAYYWYMGVASGGAGVAMFFYAMINTLG